MIINIDNGGTFTDLWAQDGNRHYRTKTRTTPHDLSECLFEGLKNLAEQVVGQRDLLPLLRLTRAIRYSTTQGTNALVQRKGPRIGLITDASLQADQLAGTDAEVRDMYDSVVGERSVQLSLEDVHRLTQSPAAQCAQVVLETVNRLTSQGANRIVLSLGSRAAEQAFLRIARQKFPQHLLGTVPMLSTADVTADTDRTRATWTALLNAFLHPAMERFLFNVDQRLRAMKFGAPLLVFRNDALAGRVAKTAAIKTYGSGPEGGMRGAVALAKAYQHDHLVSIDVGGTTTDIGVVANGQAPLKRNGAIEAVTVSIPLSELRSVGVGGGSIIRAEDGRIAVGPQSVGASPGPACFGFGGTEATITDIKLLKGQIDQRRYFGGRMALDAARAEAAVMNRIGTPLGLSLEEALDAAEDAWVQAVATPLKSWLKPTSVLAAFGGAGPFSVCDIADAVGVRQVLVPGMAAVFSASGIAHSGIGHRYDLALPRNATEEAVRREIQSLLDRAGRDLFAEGFALAACSQQWVLQTAHDDQALTVEGLHAALAQAARHGAVMATLTVQHPLQAGAASAQGTPPKARASGTTDTQLRRKVRLDGKRQEVPLHELDRMPAGSQAQGPAIVEDDYFTLPVPEGWRFEITATGDIVLKRR